MAFHITNTKRAALGLSIFGIVLLASTQFARAYVASDFTDIDNGNAATFAGDTNVKLGEFTTPTPATDTLVFNGDGGAVAAGNALTSFGSSYYYVDNNNEGSGQYDSGELVVNSPDTTLNLTDIVSNSAAGLLSSFGTSEAAGVTGYLDQDSNGSIGANEDIVKIVASGEGSALVNNNTIKLFPIADDLDEWSNFFLAPNSTRAFDYSNPPAILAYSNSASEIGSTINIVRGGDVQFTTFDGSDPVCVDNAADDGVFNVGTDIFWWDAAGTCATFNSGVDIVLNNNSSSPFSGNEYRISDIGLPGFFGAITLGYSDSDGNGAYTCSRGGNCEFFFILGGSSSYPTGTLVTAGQTFMGLYGDTNNLTDGVSNIADYPTELPNPASTNVVLMDQQTLNSEKQYAYIDSDSDDTYDENEDIIELTASGSFAAVATGQKFRYFGSGEKFIDATSFNGTYDSGEALVLSTDANLDAGYLNGEGTDYMLFPGLDLMSSFAANEMYHDSDESGTYTTGEDIVRDVDNSGYYNADDFLSIKFVNSTIDYPFEDEDLDGMYLYKKVGGSCAGAEVDTLVGSLGSAPFFDTAITVTDTLATAATDYCLYIDISADADAGEYAQISIPQNGADFSSASTSPSDDQIDFSESGHYVTIARFMSGDMTEGSLNASALTSYIFAFTPSTDLPTGSRMYAGFPEEYSVDGASISCLADSVLVDGTSSVLIDLYPALTLSETVSAGSSVVCTVTHVRNPSSEGFYEGFLLYTQKNVEINLINADLAWDIGTAEIVAVAQHSRGGSAPVIASSISLTSPVGNATVSSPVTINWVSAGQAIDYANVFYVLDGHRHEIAHNIPNGGMYSWNAPASLAGQTILLSVELTDLASSIASDSESITIAGEGAPVPPTVNPEDNLLCKDYSWTVPNLSSHLVKAPNNSTVYYLAPDNMLRPFFNEALFKSWKLKFSDVQTVSSAQLSQYPLGSPMAPLPGSALVKSNLDNRVYVLEPNDTNPARPYLHWIKSEEVAKAYFGSAWASKIIDVVPSIIVMSPQGNDLTDPSTAPCYVSLYN